MLMTTDIIVVLIEDLIVEQKNTKIEIVKNMLIDNKNYDEIMKYTHLTESEIHNIKLNMQQ